MSASFNDIGLNKYTGKKLSFKNEIYYSFIYIVLYEIYYQCNIIYDVNKLYLETSGYYLLDHKMLCYKRSVGTKDHLYNGLWLKPYLQVTYRVYLRSLRINDNGTLRNFVSHSYINLQSVNILFLMLKIFSILKPYG